MLRKAANKWLCKCHLSFPRYPIKFLNGTHFQQQFSSDCDLALKKYNQLTQNQQLYLETIKKDYERAITSRLTKHSSISEKFINKFHLLYEFYQEHCDILDNIIECHGLFIDSEMKDLAESEITSLKNDLSQCYNNILFEIEQSLQPTGGSIFLEIRSAAGGTESSVFAADLYRVYEAIALNKGYKWTILDDDFQDKGKIDQIIIEITGSDAGSMFQFEGGVHRVQRVPFNDTRIHTSTVAVIVSSKPDDINIEIKPDDLEISFTKSSGPGGQHGDSKKTKCKIYHKPSDTLITSQISRNASDNKDDCISRLKSILLKREIDSRTSDANQNMKKQVKHGERAEKIRTYNYKSGIVVDHRHKVEVINVIDYLTDPNKFMELHKKVSIAWQLEQLAEIANNLSMD